MSLWFLLPAVAVVSLVLTGVLRRYALARSLMDIPNARSSHSVPTPRGGGVAIVICFLGALPALAALSVLHWSSVWALLGAGTAVALVGFLDDHSHIAARWRLMAHFAAAVWALVWLGGAPPLALPGSVVVDPGWLGGALAAVYLVWLLNLYNFMDGIDGIAGVDAVCVSGGGAALYAFVGQWALAAAPLMLAVAVMGFLVWNFPRPRIFIGECGQRVSWHYIGSDVVAGRLGEAGFVLGLGDSAWLVHR